MRLVPNWAGDEEEHGMKMDVGVVVFLVGMYLITVGFIYFCDKV